MTEHFYDGETFEFEFDGVAYVATVTRDSVGGAPWDEEDGHGDVSDWTTRDKLPGELVLNEDRDRKRFYDFAGACRTARRDGWGFLPGKLKYEKRADCWHAWCEGFDGKEHISTDVNRAVSAVYEEHRATMTARQYAAGAAMADFNRLRAWCNDEWFYVGVTVRRADACECSGDSESLWGIESDAGEYIRQVAEELAEELAEQLAEQRADA